MADEFTLPHAAPLPVWLTVEQAAAYAQVGPKTIYAACRAGTLRHARINGRRDIRLRVEWVDQFLDATATPIEVEVRR